MSFRAIERENIYQGRAFAVERVQMRLPDGAIRPYDLVQHNGSVTIVPLDDQGNLYFVNQYRIGAGEDLLELPAGVLEKGEDPEICAAREVREETGMQASTLTLLGDFYLAPGYSSEHMYVFLATGLSPNPLAHDLDEFLQIQVIPLSKAMQMARSSQIKDAKTLASLFLAFERLSA